VPSARCARRWGPSALAAPAVCVGAKAPSATPLGPPGSRQPRQALSRSCAPASEAGLRQDRQSPRWEAPSSATQGLSAPRPPPPGKGQAPCRAHAEPSPSLPAPVARDASRQAGDAVRRSRRVPTARSYLRSRGYRPSPRPGRTRAAVAGDRARGRVAPTPLASRPRPCLPGLRDGSCPPGIQGAPALSPCSRPIRGSRWGRVRACACCRGQSSSDNVVGVTKFFTQTTNENGSFHTC
jgi:hypothetical protein